ncbi:MAG: ECF-type sigma factor [Planctomycetota bacterium]
MTERDSSEVGEPTRLLGRIRSGDRQAEGELFALLQRELRDVAGRMIRKAGPNCTLRTGDLIQEVYLRLFGKQPPELNDRQHFLSVAAQAMGWILRDRARRRMAAKRGGGEIAAEVDPLLAGYDERPEEMVALCDSVDALRALDEDAARVVELRFFLGLTSGEVAQELGVSERTAQRRWEAARRYLWQDWRGGDGESPAAGE